MEENSILHDHVTALLHEHMTNSFAYSTTVVPTKGDSDAILCLQLLS